MHPGTKALRREGFCGSVATGSEANVATTATANKYTNDGKRKWPRISQRVTKITANGISM